MSSILIVDEPKESHELLHTLLNPLGHKITFVSGEDKALQLYGKEQFDIVVAENSGPAPGQESLLKKLHAVDPKAVVIMTDAVPELRKAIVAMRNRCFDYIKKPIKVADFVSAINRGLEYKYPQLNKSKPIKRNGNGKHAPTDTCVALVGNHPSIVTVRQQIDKILRDRNATAISIQGPAGSGKHYVIEYIHQRLGAAPDNLLTLNCSSANPDNLMEMLIGDGMGGTLVKQAKGGTLALSKINALPLAIQKSFVNVLRNLGNQTLVIVTSDENLEDALLDDSFAMELYYYITIEVLVLPPLENRRDDMPLIIRELMRTSPEIDENLRKIEFTPDAIEALLRHKEAFHFNELARMLNDCASYHDRGRVTSKEVSIIFG